MIKHTLFLQPRGKTQTQLPLTVAQAAHLLKKKLMQKTGSIPGQINYHSTAKLANVKKAMGEVKEPKPEAEPEQKPEAAPAEPVATVATTATKAKAKPKAKTKGKTPTKKSSGKTAPAANPEPVEPVVAAAVVAAPEATSAPALPEPTPETKELVAQPA